MDCKGLVHIYCGDGKGKTTAALGLSIRCLGGSGRVLFYQFLKDGSSSEINILKKIQNIDVIEGYKDIKFYFNMNDDEKRKAKAYYSKMFKVVTDKAKSGSYDMIVLDEILYAAGIGYITSEEILDFINTKPYGLEVVLTGRNPDKRICDCADYISEIKKIKHPFDKGIGARKLIER